MSATSADRANYWIAFAAVVALVLVIGFWMRMSDYQKRKLLGS